MDRSKVIGRRISQIIIDEGITCAAFGESIGSSRTAVHEWTSGTRVPYAPKLIQICETYHVSADWLLGIVDQK